MERIINAVEEKLKSLEDGIAWRDMKIERLERELKEAKDEIKCFESMMAQKQAVECQPLERTC